MKQENQFKRIRN